MPGYNCYITNKNTNSLFQFMVLIFVFANQNRHMRVVNNKITDTPHDCTTQGTMATTSGYDQFTILLLGSFRYGFTRGTSQSFQCMLDLHLEKMFVMNGMKELLVKTEKRSRYLDSVYDN